jgi:predicted small lipoprotein YifL
MPYTSDFPVISRLRRFFPVFAVAKFPDTPRANSCRADRKYLIQKVLSPTSPTGFAPDFDFLREFSRKTGNLRLRRPYFAAVMALFILVLPQAGCGKKGPPQPPPDQPNTYPRPYPSE